MFKEILFKGGSGALKASMLKNVHHNRRFEKQQQWVAFSLERVFHQKTFVSSYVHVFLMVFSYVVDTLISCWFHKFR